MWKEKSIAFAVHFLVTVITSGLCAICVYGLWYPGAFAQMVGGANIFRLIIITEFCLGPVLSFVIYNSKKTRKHLVADYCVVGLFQLSALAYGVFTVAQGRPIYMVFVKDRLEVIARTELSQEELAQVRDAKVSPGWLGPKLICVDYPADPHERSDLLMSALAGKDIQLKPNYYRQCQNGEVIGKSFSKERLFSDTKIRSAGLPKEIADKDFTWLPVVTRFGAWLAVYVNAEKEIYLNLDPFIEDPGNVPNT
jgi:hypothetical protein